MTTLLQRIKMAATRSIAPEKKKDYRELLAAMARGEDFDEESAAEIIGGRSLSEVRGHVDLLKRRIQAKQDMEADPAELERISESAAEVEKQRQEVLKTIEAHREAVNKYEYMAAQQTTKQALADNRIRKARNVLTSTCGTDWFDRAAAVQNEINAIEHQKREFAGVDNELASVQSEMDRLDLQIGKNSSPEPSIDRVALKSQRAILLGKRDQLADGVKRLRELERESADAQQRLEAIEAEPLDPFALNVDVPARPAGPQPL